MKVAPVVPAPERTAEEIRVERTESFRRLAGEQLPRLYSSARRLVGDEAEDAVQDCLLKAFQRFDQLNDIAAGPAWLTAILVNCCRDRGRERARRPEEIDFDELERFSLYRKIAREDPFPYSDSLHLDFLAEFGTEDVRGADEAAEALPPTAGWRACTAGASCSSGRCGTTLRKPICC